MPSDLENAALRFRADLLRRERRAASAMVQVYGEAWRRIRPRLEDVQAAIADARARGIAHSPAWLYQEARYLALQSQIESELRRFAGMAEGSTLATQRIAVTAAQESARALTELSMGTPIGQVWNRLPTESVEDLVGFAADGSPLRALFNSIVPGVADAMRDTLASAIAMGLNPREIARLMSRAYGVGLSRALRISRTETMRAYREASRRNYEANSDIVTGWIWVSALDRRTCPSCWAMHGTAHDLKETLNDHPNGRCVMVPKTKTWRALGIDADERMPEIRRGADIFAQLSPAGQQEILGPAMWLAWSNRAFVFEDVVGIRRSTVWGDTRYARSLTEIVGPEAARRWIREVRRLRVAVR